MDAVKVMEACRQKGTDCMITPCEADSQLVHLQKSGLVNYIISKDSDLLVAGDPEYTKVIYKYNFDDNMSQLICLKDLFERHRSKFQGFSQVMFRSMCVLSGCDYLPSVKQVGIVKAKNAIQEAHGDIEGAVDISLQELPDSSRSC